jgi:hypothetical protein
MRHLAFGPRQSGRTSLLINEIVREMEYHNRKVYVVAGSYTTAHHIRHTIRSINESVFRIIPMSIHDINILRGVDARDIYFEHTAYEQANSKQLIEIYAIEDRKAEIIWGVP